MKRRRHQREGPRRATPRKRSAQVAAAAATGYARENESHEHHQELITMLATIEPTIATVPAKAVTTVPVTEAAEASIALKNDYGVVNRALYTNRGRREATAVFMRMRAQVNTGKPARITGLEKALVVAALGELFGQEFAGTQLAEAAARVQADVLTRFAV